jgi:hypothetical protein
MEVGNKDSEGSDNEVSDADDENIPECSIIEVEGDSSPEKEYDEYRELLKKKLSKTIKKRN